jgi:hypothetical protein
MKFFGCCGTWLLLFAASLPATIAAGDTDPTDKDPSAMFAVRQQADLESWRTDGGKNLQLALRGLDELEKPAGAGKAILVVAKVGQTHVALLRAARDAERLLVWSEVAGVDLNFRIAAARKRLDALLLRLATAPDIKARINIDMQNFGALLKRVPKERIKKVLKAEQNQNWEEADEALFEIREAFEPTIVWHPYRELQGDMKPYDDKKNEIQPHRDEARRKLAVTQLAALAQQTTPDFAAIAVRVVDAIKSVGATGQAAVFKDSVPAPQVMLDLVALWQETDAAVLRARALIWARLELDEKARVEATQLDAGYAQLVQTMRAQLVALVAADAARLAPADVEPRYKAWMQSAGAASAALADPALRKSLSAALDQLAAKSPEMDKQVKLYHQATDDMLRWRERTVQSYVQFHRGDSVPLEKRLHDAAGPQGKSLGFFPHDAGALELLDAAPVVIPPLAEKTIGTSAIVQRVFLHTALNGATSPAALSGLSGLDHRTYAQVGEVPDIQPAAAALRADLGVSGLGSAAPSSTAPLEPLTLDAAEALLAAELGAVDSIGGKITGLRVEGLIPRLAAVSTTDLLSRPQPLPAENAGKAQAQLLIRFTLEPTWIAGRYFVVARR